MLSKLFILLICGFLYIHTHTFSQTLDLSKALSSKEFLFSQREYWEISLQNYVTGSKVSLHNESPKLLSPLGIGGNINVNYHYYWQKSFSGLIGLGLGWYPFGYGEFYNSQDEFFSDGNTGSIFRSYIYSYYFSLPIHFYYHRPLKENTYFRLGLGMRARFPFVGWGGISSSSIDDQGFVRPRWIIDAYYPDQKPINLLMSGSIGLTHILPHYHIMNFDLVYHFGLNRLMETDYRFFNDEGDVIHEGQWFTNGSYLALEVSYSLSKTNRYMRDIEESQSQKSDLRLYWEDRKQKRQLKRALNYTFLDSLAQYPHLELSKKIFRRPRLALKYGSFLSYTQSSLQSGSTSFNTKPHHSFYFGLSSHIDFNPHWGLMLGLDYGHQYYYYEIALPRDHLPFDEFWAYDQGFSPFLNIPIQLKYSILHQKNWVTQIKSGLSLKKYFAVSSFYEDDVEAYAPAPDGTDELYYNLTYSRPQQVFLNIPISIGIQKRFKDFSAINLDLVFNYAPGNMLEMPYTFFPGQPNESKGMLKAKNSFLGIEIGYILPKSKKIYERFGQPDTELYLH